MDKNQKFVQPKAYLSSILSFQLFKLYPDVYAILLNDIHLQLIPKTTINQQKTYSQLFDETIKHIPVELHEKLVKITAEFIKDQNKLTEQKIPALFQGSLPEEYRSKCNCLNFLLWTD
ncbi:MAG: hypothetical protein EOO07_01360 [Chitinophagaceae bacterium]|nr:MAG: hypothetical protein EOO07_01360 [Chitinophagaceae bacterium]